MFDLLAQHYREVHHHRVQEQDQQRQLPVHPQQHGGRSRQRQDGDEELAHRHADEVVQRVQVGDEMRGHLTAAHGLVLGHRDALQPQQQVTANAVHDILGDKGELARLPYTQQHRCKAQGDGHQQDGSDVQHRPVPGGREHPVHVIDQETRLLEQHFIDQQRHHQRQRHACQHREKSDHVRRDQLAAVFPDNVQNPSPAVAVHCRDRQIIG